MKRLSVVAVVIVVSFSIAISPALAGKPGSQVGAEQNQEQTTGDAEPGGPAPGGGPNDGETTDAGFGPSGTSGDGVSDGSDLDSPNGPNGN